MRHSGLPRDKRGDRAPLSRLVKVGIRRLREGKLQRGSDQVAGEEPLEIRVDGTSLAVTMRTPGEDFELAAGFLFSEGVLKEPVKRMVGAQNVVDVELHYPVDLSRFSRHVYTSSSCGVCGKASLELVQSECRVPPRGEFQVSPELICGLPDRLREHQKLFSVTGGLHGCGLFALDGNLLLAREDVGRHNALDKLIGACFLEGKLPLSDTLLVLSGRASFELIQKAAMAGIPAVIAVGAPSSLAVRLASQHDITLAGFVRADRMNLYAGFQRVSRS